MTLKRRKVEASLKKKGFIQSNAHHKRFIYTMLNGKKTNIFTKTSHGSSGQDISDKLVDIMAKQCKLDKKTFTNLVECDVEQNEYEALLIQKKELHT